MTGELTSVLGVVVLCCVVVLLLKLVCTKSKNPAVDHLPG